MFVACIELRLHERRRCLIVQQLKTLTRHVAKFQLMGATFVHAVDLQQGHDTRPNVLVQSICFQIRLLQGFSCKRLIDGFSRGFKLVFIDTAMQTFELIFVQLEFLFTQGIRLREIRLERLPQLSCIITVESVL